MMLAVKNAVEEPSTAAEAAVQKGTDASSNDVM